jgi:thiamine kinase-like enzyme
MLEIKRVEKEKVEGELGIDLSNQEIFFNKIKGEYFKKENIKACINDLTPANVIIKDDGQLVFSDFELFSFDNYTVDIAYLWIFLWRYRNWQRELLLNTIKNDRDREYFRASIIRIMFLLYDWPYNSMKNKPKLKHEKYNRRHIWAKYLIAAGKSYEAIMEVKK